MIPKAVPGVPTEVLDPLRAWSYARGYDRTAADLVVRFEENFRSLAGTVGEDVRAAAIRAAARHPAG